jgi:hypothetical protein
MRSGGALWSDFSALHFVIALTPMIPTALSVKPFINRAYSRAMPFSANSFLAFSFLVKCIRPMPRSTLGALVNWILS